MSSSTIYEALAPETATDTKSTPMMLQWQKCKENAGDALLFFRMGDFYEAFYDDAVIMARELELTLTKRQDIPMCGVPHHTSENYIDKLVSKGYRIAVAEQTEDPKQAKGLVKRELVRVVTPGTVINSSLLSDNNNNYVASVTQIGQLFGLAVLDLTTAEFFVIELSGEQELLNEIHRLRPSELVIAPKLQSRQKTLWEDLRKSYDFLISSHDDWRFEHQTAHDFLVNHLKVKMLDGFGLYGKVAAINAAGGLLSYLQDILCLSLAHVQEIRTFSTSSYMSIDTSTRRHLELTEPLTASSRRSTLFHILNETHTPMGARLLRQWINQPLLDTTEIMHRQDAVEAFCTHSQSVRQLSELLKGVRDIERLIMRVSSGHASPKDLAALKNSFEPIPQLKNSLQSIQGNSQILAHDEKAIEAHHEMVALISAALVDDPPFRINDGRVFRDGYCKELDDLREISKDSKTWLARYQNDLKESTGIKTLKVSFNRMFGYYIEVSKGQAEKMPETFQRRQTLVNAERFITPELKNYETNVMHAEERILAIEAELFADLKAKVAAFGPGIQKTAQALARVDALHSLAIIARRYDYVRPRVDNSHQFEIAAGRHPVIEASLNAERFIANDTLLDSDKNRLLLITGPNMAGKSTFIRQVALIAIMAQMGSFVPAASCHLGIIDKVFSRIGASDDLARGQSTFMVEMVETANILNNATDRSLVILDEIGRGTSTYDGISIAWSVAEYLLTAENKMAKTLFATHYWELTKLEEKVPGAVNYHVAVQECEDSIIFLRKIVRGGTDKSYGIHVGRLAGLPPVVIARSKEILVHLEENANRKSAFEPSPAKRVLPKKSKDNPDALQMTFFGV